MSGGTALAVNLWRCQLSKPTPISLALLSLLSQSSFASERLRPPRRVELRRSSKRVVLMSVVVIQSCRHVCGFSRLRERPSAVFFVFAPARATLAADLSLNVSHSAPWSTARIPNEAGFRAALNYAAWMGSDGTVPRSGLKSGQERLTGAFKPQSRANDSGPTSLLRNLRDKTLKKASLCFI